MSRVNEPRAGDEQRVGEYVFSKNDQIGKGTYARVFKARSLTDGKIAAVKRVNVTQLKKKLKENLEREIEILKDMRHPNIVQLFETRETKEHMYLVMEYCEQDLSKYIHDNGPLPESQIKIFSQHIAAAMLQLLNHNIMHRDIKPQNILLKKVDGAYIAKLADFGFARYLEEDLAATLCGSPIYMAPEILDHKPYGRRADLWSIGTVLYECATGRAPFRAANYIELSHTIKRNWATLEMPQNSSAEFKDLLRKLLVLEPTNRISEDDFFHHPFLDFENYQSALAMMDEAPNLYASRDRAGLPASSGSTRSTSSLPAVPTQTPTLPKAPLVAGSSGQRPLHESGQTGEAGITGQLDTSQHEPRKRASVGDGARGQAAPVGQTSALVPLQTYPSAVGQAHAIEAPVGTHLGATTTSGGSVTVSDMYSTGLGASPILSHLSNLSLSPISDLSQSPGRRRSFMQPFVPLPHPPSTLDYYNPTPPRDEQYVPARVQGQLEYPLPEDHERGGFPAYILAEDVPSPHTVSKPYPVPPRRRSSLSQYSGSPSPGRASAVGSPATVPPFAPSSLGHLPSPSPSPSNSVTMGTSSLLASGTRRGAGSQTSQPAVRPFKARTGQRTLSGSDGSREDGGSESYVIIDKDNTEANAFADEVMRNRGLLPASTVVGLQGTGSNVSQSPMFSLAGAAISVASRYAPTRFLSGTPPADATGLSPPTHSQHFDETQLVEQLTELRRQAQAIVSLGAQCVEDAGQGVQGLGCAFALYVKALYQFKRAMALAMATLPRPHPVSVDLANAIQHLRERYNDAFERAERVKQAMARHMDLKDLPRPSAEKLMFTAAMRFNKEGAGSETLGAYDQAQVRYSNAYLLLSALRTPDAKPEDVAILDGYIMDVKRRHDHVVFLLQARRRTSSTSSS